MKVERIDHIHAYANDANAAAQLFGELFGSDLVPLGSRMNGAVEPAFIT